MRLAEIRIFAIINKAETLRNIFPQPDKVYVFNGRLYEHNSNLSWNLAMSEQEAVIEINAALKGEKVK